MDKEIYRLINAAWQLAKRYKFQKLTDEQWETIIYDSEADFGGMEDGPVKEFGSDLVMAVLRFYERLGKDGKK